MADLNTDKARLVCVPLKITVVLEWWPSDVTRTLSSRNVSELERADKRALAAGITSAELVTILEAVISFVIETGDE